MRAWCSVLQVLDTGSGGISGALILEEYKLVVGKQPVCAPSAPEGCTERLFHRQAPNFPNATIEPDPTVHADGAFDCGAGCLFNIRRDPSEYNDLSRDQPEKLDEMLHRYHAAVDDTFTPKQRPGENYKGDTERCKAFVQEHGGFKGPYLDFKTAPAAAPL